jgi:hypothetical protein
VIDRQTMDVAWGPVLVYRAETEHDARRIADWMKRLLDTLAEQFAVYIRRPVTIDSMYDFETGHPPWWKVSCRFKVVADQRHKGYYVE